MDLTEGSETSANINQTPGNHPKVDILNTVYLLSLSLSLSLVHMKVRDCEFLAWVRGQRKMSQVLDALGLLDFTMLRSVLAWRAF
jgi:hypothetical protein